MTEEQNNTCHGIIHAAAAAAGAVGAGLAQAPCSDAAVIVPIQVTMIVFLENKYRKRRCSSWL